jgi:hypothetical protein
VVMLTRLTIATNAPNQNDLVQLFMTARCQIGAQPISFILRQVFLDREAVAVIVSTNHIKLHGGTPQI